jgi:hypothetical protein
MLSDDDSGPNPAFASDYIRLLGAASTLLRDNHLWGDTLDKRKMYLAIIEEEVESEDEKHTVFLDPDTGIMEEDGGAGRKRINPRDLLDLLRTKKDRIVIIFDDSYSYSGKKEDDPYEFTARIYSTSVGLEMQHRNHLCSGDPG